MEKNTPDQEIDLMELLARFFSALHRNWILTIACPLLGVVLGFLISKSTTGATNSEMMAVTDLLSEEEGIFLTEQLEKADTIPGLTKDQANSIGKLKYEVKKGTSSSTGTQIYIVINVEIGNRQILPIVQTALLNYINNTEAVKRARLEKTEFSAAMIKKIEQELIAIEEVQRTIDAKTKGTYLNPSDLFSEGVELYNKKLNYEQTLKNAQTIHLIKGFGSLSKNAKLPLLYYMAFGFIGGIFVLFILIFIGYFASYYRKFENDKLS